MNDLLYSLEDLKLPFSDHIPSEPQYRIDETKLFKLLIALCMDLMSVLVVLLLFFSMKQFSTSYLNSLGR